MSHEFSAFELVVTALLLDRKLVKRDRLAALEMAHDFLSFVESNRGSLGEPGFTAGVEKSIAGDEAELAKAKIGETTDKFIRVDRASGSNSALHKLLEEYGANPKLLGKKYAWHLKRLKEFQHELPNKEKFDLHSPDGATTGDPFRDAVIIHRKSAIKYAKYEIERIKEEARVDQRKRRASNKNSADGTTITG